MKITGRQVIKVHKLRLYPDKKAKAFLDAHFDGVLFVKQLIWERQELSLDYNEEILPIGSCNNLLLDLKKANKHLRTVNADVLRHAVSDVFYAFCKFYNQREKYPKQKGPYEDAEFMTKNPITIQQDSFVKFPKLHSPIKFKGTILPENITTIKYAVGVRTCAEKYFLVLKVVEEIENKIYSLYTPWSTNDIKILKVEDFVLDARLQRKIYKVHENLKRKQNGSQNQKDEEKKLSLLYAKAKAQRLHFLHRVSKDLIQTNKVIFLEKLRVSERLRPALIKMLKYKASWHGVAIIN